MNDNLPEITENQFRDLVRAINNPPEERDDET